MKTKDSRVRLKKLTKKQSYLEGLRRIKRLRGSFPDTNPTRSKFFMQSEGETAR
jgi:hypothetical protein